MAKKASRKTTTNVDAPGAMESLGKKLDETPAVKAAEAALAKAKAELARAEQHCRNARQRASDELKGLANKNAGELVESTLEYVKRHPGQGLCVAALLGLFLGRLFRR